RGVDQMLEIVVLRQDQVVGMIEASVQIHEQRLLPRGHEVFLERLRRRIIAPAAVPNLRLSILNGERGLQYRIRVGGDIAMKGQVSEDTVGLVRLAVAPMTPYT